MLLLAGGLATSLTLMREAETQRTSAEVEAQRADQQRETAVENGKRAARGEPKVQRCIGRLVEVYEKLGREGDAAAWRQKQQ